jgi:hypothetical protein
MGRIFHDNAGRAYQVGLGGARLYLNVPPKKEKNTMQNGNELEEGIMNPLDNSQPRHDEHGNELGIMDPIAQDRAQDEVQNIRLAQHHYQRQHQNQNRRGNQQEEALPLPGDEFGPQSKEG